MANEDNVVRNDEEEQFQLAFGEQLTTVSRRIRNDILMIMNNIPDMINFSLGFNETNDRFSVLAWELLGRFIANNDYLKSLDLEGINLTDELMEKLFNSLVKSSSLGEVLLYNNEIGMNGIRSMVPFLSNASTLSKINLSSNRNIKTEGFEVFINALDGGTIEELNLNSCGIKNISLLGNCTLPHLRILRLNNNNIRSMGNISALQNYTNLKELHLENNNIGREGCIVISSLLQNEDSSLEVLDLDQNNIDDEGAEILATSLKHNNTLKQLYLDGNNIKEKGSLAFLKLLNDVSSIESTYNSNHTLSYLTLPRIASTMDTIRHIRAAFRININEHNPARQKVIEYQLDMEQRQRICHLQGVRYTYNGIFSEIDALVLPEVLALVGQNLGQSELYRMLVAVVPDLISVVNKEVALKERIEENVAQVVSLETEYERNLAALKDEYEHKVALLAANKSSKTTVLTIKNMELRKELEAIHSVQGSQLCGKKRDRSSKCR